MQIVLETILHEMSESVFWKRNKKKYFKLMSAEFFTQHAKPSKHYVLITFWLA